jgi:hypothetical protein
MSSPGTSHLGQEEELWYEDNPLILKIWASRLAQISSPTYGARYGPPMHVLVARTVHDLL